MSNNTKAIKLDTSGVEGEETGNDTNDNQGDEETQIALEKIVGIQHEIDKLNEQASEEILRVEQKYNLLRKPHYLKRGNLSQQIPEFWYTTNACKTQLTNHPSFCQLLNEEDDQAFLYLENVTVDEFEDVKSGYKISMYFKPNPYFADSVLSKEFSLDSSGESKVTGTDIQWKPDRDLTKTQDVAELKGRKRTHEEASSFFCWFNECIPNESDDIAEIIKDEIYPNPLQFFLSGEVSVEEGEGEGEDEDEEEDEAEGEEEEDQDELVDLDEEEETEDF